MSAAVPLEQGPQYRRDGFLGDRAFVAEAELLFERARREGFSLFFAYLELAELAQNRVRIGERGEARISREMATLLSERFATFARVGRDGGGRFMLVIQMTEAVTRNELNDIARTIVAHSFRVGSQSIRLTPAVGYATRIGAGSLDELRRRASVALGVAVSNLDLQAVCYTARLEAEASLFGRCPSLSRMRTMLDGLRAPFRIVAMLVGGLAIPFVMYCILAAKGLDVTNVIYVVYVVMLFLTAMSIWCESFLTFHAADPPPADQYPAASAIIAAYLPNEAATVIETIESFLNIAYAGELQIILAYNTPRPLPIEEELLAIARRDRRFVALRIDGSTSKAQNVNAALSIVRGAFVGIFDADHKPDPDSFTRAWNWLAYGYDVVQGHCVIRNGDASVVAQLVAVEFEAIYAVSHPGRAKLHGFGIFGGSNGYWKTELIRQTRMRRSMLTEDIDASLRVVEAGYRIANDRKLISRELAPVTLSALWHQRLRWSQGWFQVSIGHLLPALRSQNLTVRQKAGMLHLLLWREWYVWIVLQVFPLLAFWFFVRHDHLDYFVPTFVLTTILTTLTGPLQQIVAYFLADDDVKRRRGWFLRSLVLSLLFYNEFKNVVARVGQLKELMRESAWKVTPREREVTMLRRSRRGERSWPRRICASCAIRQPAIRERQERCSAVRAYSPRA
ncbi:MAG: glycosyltransferase [Candidatus Baltobacteraceae bacterium]